MNEQILNQEKELARIGQTDVYRVSSRTASPVAPITTDDTLTADLKASLLKSDLEARGICEHRQAERTARLCVSLFEEERYDAALWKAAEGLYEFMDGNHEQTELHRRNVHTRALYLTLAVQCMARLRLALEGGFPSERMAEAYTHFANHRNQLAERRHLRAVEGGKS